MSAPASAKPAVPAVLTVDWMARRPALAVTAALMCGIFVHRMLPAAPRAWTLALGIAIMAAACLLKARAAYMSAVLFIATATAGVALAQVEAFAYPRNHISAFATDQPRLAQMELELAYPPRTLTWPFGQYRSALPPRQVVTALVRRVKTLAGWIDCTGDLPVQISQPNPLLKQGQIVRVIGMLQRPAPAMNPGQFNWAGYYREQRILASLRISDAGNVRIIDDGHTGPISWLRARARHALAVGFTSRQLLDHALLRALVLGDNDPELHDIQEQFRRTGTSHHLAISGMHVAVLGGVIFWLCRLLRIRPRAACWTALLLVILYGIVALPSPPVVRSVILCATIGFGILQRRSVDALQLLAVTVVAMLVYHPLDLFNAGFQLSFGTVLGLMIFTKPVLNALPGPDLDEQVARAMQRPGRLRLVWITVQDWARVTVAAGLVAWVVSMPLIAFHFEQLNPWAILASIVLAPVVFIALVGGFAKVLLTLLWPSLASFWAGTALKPVVLMRHTVDWLATFPGSDVPFPSPPVWMVLLFYALLLLAFFPWQNLVPRWGVRTASVAGCVALAILPLRSSFAKMLSRSDELKVTLLAIGAGQCAVVEPPGVDAVLLDAGSTGQSDLLHKTLGPFLRHEGRRDIRSIFISHANLDHFSAVADTTQAYDVHDVYVAPQFRPQSVGNGAAEGLLRTLDQLDRPPKEVSSGRDFDLGGGAKIHVVWPPADCPYDANNTSLVLMLTFAGRSILFTGDIQGLAERELLNAPSAIKADVLVAPHHGSRETTTAAFVAAVAPQDIVCSNDRTLSVKQKEFDREMQNRTVYRTHTGGAITIKISREGKLVVEPYLQPRQS